MAYSDLKYKNPHNIFSNTLSITSSQPATNASTGSLIVNGGTGIHGDLYVDGTIHGLVTPQNNTFIRSYPDPVINIGDSLPNLRHFYVNPQPEPTFQIDLPEHITSTTQSSDINTGSFTTDGGVAIKKNLYVGGTINGTLSTTTPVNVTDTTQSTDTQTGAIICSGGIGVAKNVNIGGDCNVIGTMYAPHLVYQEVEYITSTIDSTSTSTGASIVAGGMGIAKSVFIGGDVKILSTTASTDNLTGSLILNGGLGITGDTNINGRIKVRRSSFGQPTNYSYLNSDNLQLYRYTGETNIGDSGVFWYFDNNLIGQLFIDDDASTYYGLVLEMDFPLGNKKISLGNSVSIGRSLYNVAPPLNGLLSAGDIICNSTTQATSTNTGSFYTAGGVGIAKNLYVGGNIYGSISSTTINITDTTQSTDTQTGAIICAGGVGIAKNTNIGGILKIWNTIASTDSNTGALECAGGASIKGKMYVNGETNLLSDLYIRNGSAYAQFHNDSSYLYLNVNVGNTFVCNPILSCNNTNDGDLLTDNSALQVLGGTVIKKSLAMGGIFRNYSTTESTNTQTGSCILSGGVGIGKNLNVGGYLTVNGSGSSIAGPVSMTNAGSQIYLSYNGSNSSSLTSSSTGNLTIGCDGHNTNFSSLDLVHILNVSNATNISTGALQVLGGASIAKDLYVGGSIYGSINGNMSTLQITSTINSTSSSTGALQVFGGIGVGNSVYVNQNITADGIINGLTVNSNSTYDSSATNNGSMVTLGGMGIAKSLYVGSNIHALADIGCNGTIGGNIVASNSTVNSTSTTTGSMICTGGLAIGKNLTIAGQLIFISGTLDMTGAGPFNNVVIPTSPQINVVGTITNNIQLTGFDSTGAVDGQRFTLTGYYASDRTIQILHDSANSLSANRIYTNTGGTVNFQMNPLATAIFMYSGAQAKWFLISIAS